MFGAHSTEVLMRDLYDDIITRKPPKYGDFDDFTDPPEDTWDADESEDEDESMDSLDELIDSILNPPAR